MNLIPPAFRAKPNNCELLDQAKLALDDVNTRMSAALESAEQAVQKVRSIDKHAEEADQ
ncbi:hypothetical protein [Sphaerisporangium rhizosphaerae]|uniref:Uncharacterized protein n=1 Tax=Sphaerisporangium rhizosphaerae TaxID=2269375 RepID=A0ABW2NVR9_9ACTN